MKKRVIKVIMVMTTVAITAEKIGNEKNECTRYAHTHKALSENFVDRALLLLLLLL